MHSLLMKIGLLEQNPALGINLHPAARIALNTLQPKKAERMVKLLRSSAVNLRNGRKDRRVRPLAGRSQYFQVQLDRAYTGILHRKEGGIEVAAIMPRGA